MTGPLVRPLLGALLLTTFTGTVAGTAHALETDARCGVAPRSYANITSLLETPPAATPSATTAGQTVEGGTPASATERLAVRKLVEEWLACQNEGRLLSAWALFSDPYLYRLISRQPAMTESLYEKWATPQPTDMPTSSLLEISGERRLDDGRLGATVRISYASVPMPKQFFFYFVEQDSTLLIDSILGEISFSVP